MKSARPSNEAKSSAPGKGVSIIGAFPARQDTVTAEVLMRLLRGERLTGLEAVFDASTTRLASVAHYLSRDYFWSILTESKATGCKDGRVVWVSEYFLADEAITQAMAGGAEGWCDQVRRARLARRIQAPEAKRAAQRTNAARRNRLRPGRMEWLEEAQL